MDYGEKRNYLSKLSREIIKINCNSIDDLKLIFIPPPPPKAVEFNLFSFSDFVDSDFKNSVPYWQDLQVLRLLSPSLVTDMGFLSLSSLTNLQSLEIRNSEYLTGRCVARLNKLTSLVELCFSGCKSLLNKDLLQLTQLQHLTSLDLSLIPAVNTKFIEVLADSFPHLFELNLSECDNLNESSLVHLFKLPYLTKLELGGCFNIKDSPHVIFRDADSIVKTRLTTLNVKSTKFAISISHFRIFRALFSLNISDTAVTDQQLIPLSTLPLLKELDVSRCKNLTNECMIYFTELFILDARSTRITIAGVSHLKEHILAQILIDDTFEM